jgi:hypothetical protein
MAAHLVVTGVDCKENDMSKARDKGTKGENEILDLLQRAGFSDAHRTESSRESHDIHCEPFIVEVKFAKRWALSDWIPKLRRVSGSKPFVLFAIHGDRRTAVGQQVGRVAVFDAEFAAELMYCYVNNKL